MRSPFIYVLKSQTIKATKIILKSWQEEFSDYDDEEDKQADDSILFISLAVFK